MGKLAYDPQSIHEPSQKLVKNGKVCDSPFLNGSLKQVKTLLCGSESCIALDVDSNIITFGWNEHGNCGCGHNLNLYQPIVIGTATFIAAGFGYSFIY